MASANFKVLPIPDDKVVEGFRAIAQAMGVEESAKIQLTYWDGSHGQLLTPLAKVEENDALRQILKIGSTIFKSARLFWPTPGGEAVVKLVQQDRDYVVSFSLPDQAEAELLTQFLVAVRSAFREYEPTKILETLAPEMAKFYEKRDDTVVRLEEALARMVRDNLEHRRQLDAQAEQKRNRTHSEFEEEKKGFRESYKEKAGELEAVYARKDDALQLREEKLKQREQELDDRSNTEARRKLHQELKPAFSIWCLTSRPSSGLERLYS